MDGDDDTHVDNHEKNNTNNKSVFSPIRSLSKVVPMDQMEEKEEEKEEDEENNSESHRYRVRTISGKVVSHHLLDMGKPNANDC